MESKNLIPALKAGYSLFFGQTYELNRSVEIIKTEIENYSNGSKWQLAIWDCEKDQDPDIILNDMNKPAVNPILFIAKNFNWFLKDGMDEPNKVFCQYFQNKVDLFSS